MRGRKKENKHTKSELVKHRRFQQCRSWRISRRVTILEGKKEGGNPEHMTIQNAKQSSDDESYKPGYTALFVYIGP